MLTHLNATARWPARTVIMGAAGFVGGALRQRLERADVSLLCLSSRDIDLLQPGAADRLAALLRPDDAFVAVSAKAPCKNANMLRDNVAMAQAMTSALQARPVSHVINISSDAVFGDLPVPLREDNPRNPGALHGVMHLARELLFSELACPVATMRPTLIYGPEDPHNGYGPNQFFRRAFAGEQITLFGDGEERRDHIWIEDVAELIALVLQHRSIGSLNLASGEVFSFREIASIVVNLFPDPVRIVGSPRKGEMPHRGYRPFNIDNIRTAFPAFQPTRLPDGLARVHQVLQARYQP